MPSSDRMSLWRADVLVPLLFISNLINFSWASFLSEFKEGNPQFRSEEELSWLHHEWVLAFDRTYENPWEREARFEIFKDNLRFIEEHNNPKNNYTYTLGLNAFADLSHEEYQAKYVFPRTDDNSLSQDGSGEDFEEEEPTDADLGNLPDSVDWRLTGAVSAVINQQTCGSCWAWAAAGAVEGFHQIQTGEMIRVSAQQLLDCSWRTSDCGGGYERHAYQYIVNNKGVDSLENYPYKAEQGDCKRDSAKLVTIKGWRNVLGMHGDELQRAVARQPVSIVLGATGRDFQLYDRGVFTGSCSGTNHVMVIVGYGSENAQDYWLLKNTWGFGWGDDGYIKIDRNAKRIGACRLTGRAIYPY